MKKMTFEEWLEVEGYDSVCPSCDYLRTHTEFLGECHGMHYETISECKYRDGVSCPEYESYLDTLEEEEDEDMDVRNDNNE